MPNRSAIFLDTGHVLALINKADQWHAAALRWSRKIAAEGLQLVTTDFVLVEIADVLAAVRARKLAANVIQAIRSNDSVEIVPGSRALFEAALAMYGSRSYKNWGLTDCASFVAMWDRGLTEALTVDRHFEQAGFRALLLES